MNEEALQHLRMECVPDTRSAERQRCLPTISCDSRDRRRRLGGRVRTWQRVSDVLQLTAALGRSRQQQFRIDNLANGKPTWVLIRCNGFTLMRRWAKTRYFFLGLLENTSLRATEQDFSALIHVSLSPQIKYHAVELKLYWTVHKGGAVCSPAEVAVPFTTSHTGAILQ